MKINYFIFEFFPYEALLMRKIIYRLLVVYSKVYLLLFTCEKQMAVQFNFVVGSILEGTLSSLTDGKRKKYSRYRE